MTEQSLLARRFWWLLWQITQAKGQSALITSLSEVSAQLSFADGRIVIIFLDEDQQAHAALENWLSHIDRTDGNAFDLLVVSNDTSLHDLLAQSAKRSRGRKIAVYALNDAGELWMGPHASNRSPIVSAAIEQKEQLPPEDTSDIQNRLHDHSSTSRQTIRELVQFQDRFQVQSYTTTISLAFVIVAFFALEELWGGSQYAPTLVRMGANAKELVFRGELWRLATSIFLHAGYLHVFFNTYVLIALGMFFNRLFGGAKLLTLLIVSGLAGSIASVLIGKTHLSIGASGAIWGLFGASAALILRPSPFLPEIIRARMRRLTIINLAINLAISFLPMIDLWAHIGGGVGGFLVGMLYVRAGAPTIDQRINTEVRSRSHRFFQLLREPIALALSLLVVVSFAFAFINDKPWRLKQNLEFSTQFIDDVDFSIAIPTLLKAKNIQKQDQVITAHFGELPFDPLTVSLQVQSLGKKMESESEQLDFLYQFLRDVAVSNRLKPIAQPEEIRQNGFLTLATSFALRDGRKLYVWYQIKEKEFIQLEVMVLANTPENITRDIPQIFASMKSFINV